MLSWSTNITDGQTDRQTDRQTTCNIKTALCTIVHCTVKTVFHAWLHHKMFSQIFQKSSGAICQPLMFTIHVMTKMCTSHINYSVMSLCVNHWMANVCQQYDLEFKWNISESISAALMLLVGRQEGHPACKTWVVGCWRGYLPGARCGFAYTQLMPLPLTVSCSSKSRLVLLFWYRLTWLVPDIVQGAVKRLQ